MGGADQAVDGIGVPLVSCADDQLMGGNDGDRDLFQRIEVFRGGCTAAGDVDHDVSVNQAAPHSTSTGRSVAEVVHVAHAVSEDGAIQGRIDDAYRTCTKAVLTSAR